MEFMSAVEQELIELRAANRRLLAQVAEREQEAHDLRHENEELKAKLAGLETRIERLTKRIYGWSSERHHPGQQQIDLGQPVTSLDEEAAPAETASDSSTATPSVLATETLASDGATSPQASTTSAPPSKPHQRAPRAPDRHPGRRRLPESAEVIETDLVVPETERLDEHGQPLPILGWRVSDKWDYRPGAYLIRRFRRAIYGQPFSAAQDRVVAAMPTFLIPRGQMTDAAVIHTVVEKFADHLPLYRQVLRAERSGFQLSRSTLVNHVVAVAEAMKPIVEAISESVRAAPFLHLDDTPVRLLDPGRGHTATARIWVYRSTDAAVFRFTATREGRHPAEFLGDYRGFIVADAYAGHEQLYGIDKAHHVACWAHVRRKFSELKDRSPLALAVVEEIQRLYRIETDIVLTSPDERHHVRHIRSRPIIQRIKDRLGIAALGRLRESDIGKAIDYTRKRWPQLERYLDHGMLPIDNNPAENALRPWAIGRKNWLFLGSHAGGERAAIIATIIENCRMQGLNPFTYLLDTVSVLHQGRTDYHALTPAAVATARDQQAQ